MRLAQRLKRKTYENNAKGVDNFTRFDYMGAAEFEFGALPQALRELRAADGVVYKRFTYGDYILRFIGTEEMFEGIEKVLDQDRWKEPPFFPWKTDYRPSDPVAGWFFLDAMTPFLVFTDKQLSFQWADNLELER